MIPARHATILWDKNLQKVMVKPFDQRDTNEMASLSSSGGAAYAFWHKLSVEELYFRLLQVFAGIVREGIPVEIVHEAFLDIPEYVATLPPCAELDALKSSDIEVELPEKFSEGYEF